MSRPRPLVAPPTDPPPLPTFLVIGAQKSATRWLHRDNFGAHPDVFTARAELSQFDHEARWSLRGSTLPLAVRRVGRGARRGRARPPGTSCGGTVPPRSPSGSMHVVARRPPHRRAAGARDRAQSALVHHIRAERLRPGVRLPEYVAATDRRTDRLGIVSGGWYASSLEPYLERFGDRLLVVLHDDVRDTPGAVYERAATHVGADPAFVPDDLEVVRNSRAQAKDSERTDAAAAPLDPGGREEVLAQFTAENARLEALIDRDLSAWSGG